MAAATSEALLARVQGSSLQNAFTQLPTGGVGPNNLDILQIASPGDNPNSPLTIAVNVDYTGAVHNPASGATIGTRLGVYYAGNQPTSGASTAAYFASAFSNLSQQDILQVVNLGGNISYWLDYLGVAHGA